MTLTPAPAPRRIPLELLRERHLSGAALARVGCSTPEELAEVVAQQFQLARLPLDGVDLSPDLATLVPRKLAERHRIVPVFSGDDITLATCDPSQLDVFDFLARQTKRPITVVVATASEIERAQRRLYDRPVALEELDDRIITQKEIAEAAPIVNGIIAGALGQKASDIHIEASERGTQIRLRIDGVLRLTESLPLELHAAIVSRIKVLANLDIAVRHVPQDGRVKLTEPGLRVDLRVSVLPTYWGEKVVCRILDNNRAVQSLDVLGFENAQRKQFEDVLHSPHGLVLVTGPTGSGKSTTLYAALNAVISPGINVVTVEDPVEYQLPGINQVQIQPKRGLTFATALRSILRQDPDVILVGEIRDRETGEIAAEAALTGHLVLASLHTNDAIGAVLRLSELGVAPPLVTPSLLAVMAQRLIRRNCPHCIQRYAPTAGELAAFGLPWVPPNTLVARSKGCARCHSSGYVGRIAVRELLVVDDDLRAMLAAQAPRHELEQHIRSIGFRSLRFAAVRAWLAGQTTAQEVLRITCR